MELSIKGISKKIGKTMVFANITITFHTNEIYLILGSNGSGKTTLLKCISTLYLPDSGNIEFQNLLIDTQIKLQQYRKHVALLFDTSKSLHPNLTLIQNIKFFLGINNINYKKVKNQIFELINKFELTSHINKTVNSLSKGMKQKLALIIIFIRNTDIILLDEPYDGLDTNSILVLKDLIKSNSKDKIIIITSPSALDDLATQTIYL